MNTALQECVNGLVLGGIYALIALGYSMVYGVVGLINFAHGEIVMMGALSCISSLGMLLGLHVAVPLALLGGVLFSMTVCMALGWGIDRLAYRPLRRAPRLAPLISAMGVSMVLQNVGMMIWGRGYTLFPRFFPEHPLLFWGARLTLVQLAILLICVVLMVLMLVVVTRTSLGRAMRAVAQNPDAARLMGVSVDGVISLTFLLGSALASIAGIMVSANYGQGYAYMGFLLGLKAFSAAVLGGIGNLAGAVLGGLILGMVESFGAAYLGPLTGGFLGSQYEDVFSFVLLILVLTLRPSGLLGSVEGERA